MDQTELLPNLVSPLLGGEIVFATDEWFAAAGKFLAVFDVVIYSKCVVRPDY